MTFFFRIDGWKKKQIIAEILGTYFMIFAGCGSVVVNLSTAGTVTFPGICAVWGLVVMVLVYSVGHISGAHMNPAVTLSFACFRHFPWIQVCVRLLPTEKHIRPFCSPGSFPLLRILFVSCSSCYRKSCC